MCRNRLSRFLVSMLVVSCLAPLALTAPFVSHTLPPDTLPPDEVLSLANLSRVQVEVHDLPHLLAELELSRQDVEDQLSHRLDDSVLKVVDDEKAAKVQVRIDATRDGDAPDMLAFSVTLSLLQAVHVNRVEKELRVPTYHHVRIGLFPKKQTAEMILVGVNLVVDHFINKVTMATSPH